MKTKIVASLGLLVASFGVASVMSFSAYAAPSPAASGDCGGAKTAIIKCSEDNSPSDGLEGNGIWALLLIAINIMTAGVGILAVGGIVYGSIRIASAGDNSANVKKGVGMILNVVAGIFAYLAMYAILQFLIPGGIFAG